MTENQILRKALQELANDGHEKAIFALSMIESSASYEVAEYITKELKVAHSELQAALRENGEGWNIATDDYVKDAQKSIVNAISVVGKLA